MRLFLIRHGQSEGNVDKTKYFEKLDCEIELTELGGTQAVTAALDIADYCDESRFAGNIFYSPYIRAEQTAHIICDKLESYGSYVICYECDPRLREREWGGLRDIVMSGQKTESHFNFFYRPDGGESFADCYDRVASFHQWLLTYHPQDDNIIVAHGEFNKLYAMYLMRWTLKEFDKWRTPRNGEVMYFNDSDLSAETPLALKVDKH
jgi:broad specificity phosphatase PhoE